MCLESVLLNAVSRRHAFRVIAGASRRLVQAAAEPLGGQITLPSRRGATPIPRLERLSVLASRFPLVNVAIIIAEFLHVDTVRGAAPHVGDRWRNW